MTLDMNGVRYRISSGDVVRRGLNIVTSRSGRGGWEYPIAHGNTAAGIGRACFNGARESRGTLHPGG